MAVSETQNSYTETPPAVQTDAQSDAPIVFLGIGVVINLVLVTAYFVWARKQLKKSGRKDE